MPKICKARWDSGVQVYLLSSMYDAERILFRIIALPTKTDLLEFFRLVRYVESFGCVYTPLVGPFTTST